MDIAHCMDSMRAMASRAVKRIAIKEMQDSQIIGLGDKSEVLRLRQAIEYVITSKCKFQSFKTQVDAIKL